MTRGEAARSFFKEGYNCSQAIVLAFADLYPDEKDFLLKTISSFGGGFGRLREVCGAFSGIAAVAGAIDGFDGKNGKSKAEHYEFIRLLADDFKRENGSIVCRELLGATEKLSSPDPSVRTEEYQKKRPCAEICKIAADILEARLKEKNAID